MDVKACDGCKKLNIDADLFGFRKLLQVNQNDPKYLQNQDAPCIGFGLRKISTRPSGYEEQLMERPDAVLCKPCCEKRAKDLFAIL